MACHIFDRRKASGIQIVSVKAAGHSILCLYRATSKERRAAHPVRIERPKRSGQVTA